MQDVCDYVRDRLRFSSPEACPTHTAAQAMDEQVGVAISRTLPSRSVPARYATAI
jgi:hypothetical protein